MNLNVGYYARLSTDRDDQLNSLENQSNYFREMISVNINTIYPYSELRLALMSSLVQNEVRKLSERVKFGIQQMSYIEKNIILEIFINY